MNGELDLQCGPESVFSVFLTDITTDFKLFCIGIAQVSNSSTENGP